MPEVLEDYSLNKTIQKKGTVQKVGVIGCGSAGQEITMLIGEHGVEVVFIDINKEKIDEIIVSIEKQIDEVISGWGLTKSDKRAILSRIHGSVDYKDLADCDLIIETINSSAPGTNKEIRKEVFRKVEKVVKKETIITSNTSSLMISDLAGVLKHPERALGLHFLTPARSVKIVEVVKGVKTNKKSFDFVFRFAKMLDKKIVTINESPGNVSTRLIIPLINEACETFSEGVASIACIDQTMKQGFGLRFGPFELADQIGIDKILKWMDNLYAEFGEQKFKASPLIKRLVRLNYKGKKAGKGFYIYEDNKIVGTTFSNIEIK